MTKPATWQGIQKSKNAANFLSAGGGKSIHLKQSAQNRAREEILWGLYTG